MNDEAARFENYVACELHTKLRLCENVSGDPYRLHYIRNKQKQETDFLITKNDTPWLLLEAKLKDGIIDKHHFDTRLVLKNIPLIQVCRESGIASMQKRDVYRISANRLFNSFL
ncbi:MAG: DUF4143 domain-containing protein [Deltaproteobacteria bacterium]|nr:DUF4143 domain-containing protein [Deltaproteobacteria bacterium]